MHEVANKRIIRLTEIVVKTRADLEALLVREAETRKLVAEKLEQLEQELLKVSDGVQSAHSALREGHWGEGPRGRSHLPIIGVKSQET